jgi:hypothetical protein
MLGMSATLPYTQTNLIDRYARSEKKTTAVLYKSNHIIFILFADMLLLLTVGQAAHNQAVLALALTTISVRNRPVLSMVREVYRML